MLINRIATAFLVAAVSSTAYGALTFYSAPDQLEADLFVDIAKLGQDGPDFETALDFTQQPALNTVEFSSDGILEKRTEGKTWNGAFDKGESVLVTRGNARSITVHLAKPVAGLGTYVSSTRPGSYTAVLEALGPDDTIMGTYSRVGFNAGLGSGEAPYLAVASDSTDLVGIRLSILEGGDVAISNVDVKSGPVPEAHVLAAASIVGLWWLRRRTA